MDSVKTGKTISELRINMGMTQRDLANKLGVTDKAVSRWERGMGMPDVSLLVKLAQILDTDIETVLSGDTVKPESVWKGALWVNYPAGIEADTLIYDKRIIDYQAGFFMLAGIRDIVLFLNNSKKDRMKKIVSGLKKYGLNISLSIIDEEISDIRDCEAFRELESKEKIMLIEGLDFIFCKDLTRTLRRIMQESETPVRLTDFNKQPLSVCFYPEKHNQDIHRHQLYSLGRGVCTFRIDGMDSLWDASVLMRIIENHQHEKIGSIEDIARNKHFI